MATLYWYKAGADAHWDTLTGNWWNDASHSSQASAIPVSGDAVVLLGADPPDSSPALDVYDLAGFDTTGLTALSYTSPANIGLAAGGVLTMGDSTDTLATVHRWIGGAIGSWTSATFYSHSEAAGDISGDAVFNHNSVADGGPGACSTVTFNNNSKNISTCSASTAITFNDDSFNDTTGEVTVGTQDPVAFTGSSINKGTTTYGATFAGFSYNDGTVGGDAVFSDSSYNNDTVTGSATFNAGTRNTASGLVSTDGTFNDTAYNLGTVSGNAAFTALAYSTTAIPGILNPTGTVTGTITFDNAAVFTVDGTEDWSWDATNWAGSPTWDFRTTSTNSGTTLGATFSGASYNAASGKVEGDAVFNEYGHNRGTITGSATFTGGQYSTAFCGVMDPVNAAGITGTITFTSNPTTFYVVGAENWTIDTIGWVGTGFTWEFDGVGDNTQNSAVITGNATFGGASINAGTVTGNATFNNSAKNTGNVDGTATFTGSTYSTALTGTFDPVGPGTLGSILFQNAVQFIIETGETFSVDAGTWSFASSAEWVFNSSELTGTLPSGTLATFNGSAQNGGYPYDAVFNNSSANNSTVSNGASFYDTSINFGTVTGSASFHASNYSSAILGGGFLTPQQGTAGTTQFNAGTVLFEVESGETWTVDPTTWSYIGTPTWKFADGAATSTVITYNVVLSGISIPQATLLINCTGYISFTNAATPTITIDSANFEQAIGNWTFNVPPIWYFTGNVANRIGSLPGEVQFDNGAINDTSITLGDDVVFSNAAVNAGTVGVRAIFNSGSSISSGGVAGDYAVFNGNSYVDVNGTVGQYATFNDTSYNNGGYVGNYFVINSTNTLSYAGYWGLTYPLVAHNHVRRDTACGPTQTGSCDVPNPGDVRLGVAVDYLQTGVVTIPSAADVRKGVVYDNVAGGLLRKVGTLEPGAEGWGGGSFGT